MQERYENLQLVSKPPQEDHQAAQLDEGVIDEAVILVAHEEASEVTEPGECPFNFEAAAVAPEFTAILASGTLASAPMRADENRETL